MVVRGTLRAVANFGDQSLGSDIQYWKDFGIQRVEDFTQSPEGLKLHKTEPMNNRK